MNPESATKRRRVQRPPSPVYKLDDEDDTYEPYIPVAQRREAKLAKLANRGASAGQQSLQAQKKLQDEREMERAEASEEEIRREKARKDRTLLAEAQDVHSKKAAEGTLPVQLICKLVDVQLDAKKTEGEKREEEDEEILAAIASRRKLASDLELARGIEYTESLKTSFVHFSTIFKTVADFL
jgi:ATP-dependent RNA helicase DDX41